MMPRKAAPPRYLAMRCPRCGWQHIDHNTEEFAYAEKNHSRHLCENPKCRRLWFGEYAIGVPTTDPRVSRLPFVEVEVRQHLKSCRDEVCDHYEWPHPAPVGLWSTCPGCDVECAPGINPCVCCKKQGGAT
jgi:hypothetical protein